MPRPLSEDEAWIVSHNLPLVESFLRGRNRDDATWQDLRAAGYLGLCYAIRRFDPEIACWSTYAGYWIRQHIQYELHAQELVHIPEYQRWNRKDPKHQLSKRNNLAAVQRHMAARYVSWDNREAVAVLAVASSPEPSEIDHHALQPFLHELDERHQAIVRRVVMHGEQLTDVARELGLHKSSVAKMRDRALRQLRCRIRQERPGWALP